MQKFNESKTTRNYYIDVLAFLPFLLLLLSGIVLLQYHGGKAYVLETFGLNGDAWTIVHKTLTVVAIPLVMIHLFLHLDWLKKLFTLKLKSKHKGLNVTLFIIFMLCVLTSLFSWLIFNDSSIGNALKGMHNKFGILLIVFFAIHMLNYTKWIIAMTKQVFKRG